MVYLYLIVEVGAEAVVGDVVGIAHFVEDFRATVDFVCRSSVQPLCVVHGRGAAVAVIAAAVNMEFCHTLLWFVDGGYCFDILIFPRRFALMDRIAGRVGVWIIVLRSTSWSICALPGLAGGTGVQKPGIHDFIGREHGVRYAFCYAVYERRTDI